DRDQAAGGVDELAEIAPAEGRGGDGAELRAGRALAVALVAEEEERLVAAVVDPRDAHGPIELEAVLVEEVLRLGSSARVQDEGIRVQGLAAHELVHAAVQGVEPRLERLGDNTSRRT